MTPAQETKRAKLAKKTWESLGNHACLVPRPAILVSYLLNGTFPNFSPCLKVPARGIAAIPEKERPATIFRSFLG